MNNKSIECVIIIPLYRDYLFEFEEISLKQCINVLNSNYKIIFLIPNSFHIDIILNKYNVNLIDQQIEYIKFDDIYFESVDMFNVLLLNPNLFEIIKNDGYKYMLLYELDGFVLYDNLQYWIDKNYNYLGAIGFGSMYEHKKYCNIEKKFGMAGGISLRLLDYEINTLYNAPGHIISSNVWEDQLLSFYSPYIDINHMPKPIETYEFCWSYNYSFSNIMNNFKLPMFLHYYQYNAQYYNICKYKYENKIYNNEIEEL